MTGGVSLLIFKNILYVAILAVAVHDRSHTLLVATAAVGVSSHAL
jgi:hypothetical protein